MELRRQVFLQKLSLLGKHIANDGRLLRELTADELESEYSKVLDKETVKNNG